MTKTHTMRSRLISLVLVLVMVLGCLPMSALALNDQNRLKFADNDPVTLTLPEEAVEGETYDVDFSVKLKVNASNFTGSPFGNGTFTYDLYLSLESGDANANIQGGARTLAATLNVDTGAKTIDVLGAGAYGVTSEVMSGTNTTLITITGTVQYTPKNLENDGSVKATAYLYNGTTLDEYETETVNIEKPGEVSSDVTITVNDDTNDNATVAFTPPSLPETGFSYHSILPP